MSAAIRSPERLTAVPTDRPEAGTNQRRVDDAFRLLGTAVLRLVTSPNPSAYVIDLASRDGTLQDVWCRDEASAGPLTDLLPADPSGVAAGRFGLVNAERYVHAQKALSALLLELARPGYTGSATLRIRGTAGEIGEEIRGESRRLWHI